MNNSGFDANLKKDRTISVKIGGFSWYSFTFQVIILAVTPLRADAPFVSYNEIAIFSRWVQYESDHFSGRTVRPHH